MKWITTIILFFGINLSLFSQITPSVYTGSGLGTNLGGLVGIGTEVRYKCISANAAIGGSYFFGYENFKLTGDHPNLGFDVGVKCYVFKGLFVGVNYGVVDKHHYQTEETGVRKVEDVKAFSFTIGHKQNIYKGLYGCSRLKQVTWPDHVTEIANPIFDSCEGLEEMTLPTGITAVPDELFNRCSHLKRVTLPQGIKSIGAAAFQFCYELQSVNIPDGVETIGICGATSTPKWLMEQCRDAIEALSP